MSLTSDVNNQHGLIWTMLQESGGDKKLREFCQRKTQEMAHIIPPQPISLIQDRMLVGMAMRYSLMEMWGLNYLRDHPISRHYKRKTGEGFDEVFTSFGSNRDQGFLWLALLDKTQRTGNLHDLDPFWLTHPARLIRGVRKFDSVDETSLPTRIAKDISDINSLTNSMWDHFQHPSISGRGTTCIYCGVFQVPEKVWNCKKCGAPLTYNGLSVSGLGVFNKPDYKFVDLNPTYSGAIGGADAPLAVAWRAFSIRTVTKSIITPEHVLMAWGWWALYDERNCPPWQTSTIYYSRQQFELTFEFESMNKMLGIDLRKFHDALDDSGRRCPYDWVRMEFDDNE
jgi:hypothetical protein